MGVLASSEVTGSSRMDCIPLLEAPPAASTMNAKGAHSYSSLSFAGADVLTGLMNRPPPCAEPFPITPLLEAEFMWDA